MGDKVGRAALFGIPLQQEWSYRGVRRHTRRPTTSIRTRRSTTTRSPTRTSRWRTARCRRRRQARVRSDDHRLQPGGHVRRRSRPPRAPDFPGVFSGIGEFSIHKEFVSAKVAGGAASLLGPRARSDPGLRRRGGPRRRSSTTTSTCRSRRRAKAPCTCDQMKALFERHPNEHDHLGAHRPRTRRPARSRTTPRLIEEMLDDPRSRNVYFDISWNEVAKYVVASRETVHDRARSPSLDSTPIGSCSAPTRSRRRAPRSTSGCTSSTRRSGRPRRPRREKVLKGNYERLFDAARVRVRAWERSHVAAARVSVTSCRCRCRRRAG